MVSVKGSEFRAAENAEKRRESVKRANHEHNQLRAETERRVLGHTHNCVAAGCFGTAAREKYLADKSRADNSSAASENAAGTGDRIQGMPYLVGADRAKDD